MHCKVLGKKKINAEMTIWLIILRQCLILAFVDSFYLYDIKGRLCSDSNLKIKVFCNVKLKMEFIDKWHFDDVSNNKDLIMRCMRTTI